MSEIDKSFTFLHDNIPQWLQDITRLEEMVAAMHQEMAKVPVAMPPLAKHTTGSVESIQHERVGAVAGAGGPSQATQTDPLVTRKRKTPSMQSNRASLPSRYRPRALVVVNYDGDMQKSFELMVRAIGTGRNMLRKAKMEAKMNELAALAGPSDDEDEADDDQEEAMNAKITYRPRISSMRTRAAARRDVSQSATMPVALFDTTDKTLEHAQSLCEKAAHAILRDGDCRTELGGMRKSLVDVLETAKTQVTRCSAARPPPPTDLPSLTTSDSSLSSTEPTYKKHFPQLSRPLPEPQSKNTLPSIPVNVPPHTTPKIMDIEVDDDDDEDEPEFVMPPLRLTSRFAVRA
jgi:hypothetical protein